MIYYNLTTRSFYHETIPDLIPQESDIREITEEAYSLINAGGYFVEHDKVGSKHLINADMLLVL